MDADAPKARDQSDLPGVFLSYSRDDIEFVERLHATLEANSIEAHLDRHDIEKGEDWWARLQQLITVSDTIVFVLSPSSASSDICRREVEFAASLNKRLIPVVISDLGATQPPEDLTRLNYIFFTPDARAGARGDYEGASAELLRAITTDIEWIREHTRLGGLALRWQGSAQSKALLLRGSELELAEAWLGAGSRDAPNPTALTVRFIAQSRKAATGRLRLGLGVAAVVTAGSVAAAVFSYTQWTRAESEARTALSRQLAAQSGAMSATDFGGALRVAASAYELEDNLETRGALLAVTSGNPNTVAILGADADITHIAASPTQPYVAMGQADGAVRVWNVAAQSWDARRDTGLTGRVTAVAFGQDASHLAVADDTGARFVEIGPDRRITLPPQDAGWVTVGFAFNPSATLLAEVSQGGMDGYDEILRFWDMSGAPHLFGTIDPQDLIHVEHMVFPSDALFHYVNWGTLRGVDLQTGTIEDVAQHGKFNRPGPSAYSASGRLGVASGFDTGGFFVFDALTGAEIGAGEVAAAPIDAIALSHDDARLAIAQERRISVFDIYGTRVASFDAGLSKIETLMFASDSNLLIALSPSRQAHVFDLSSPPQRLSREIAPEFEDGVPSVIQGVMDAAFSPDGRYLGWIGYTGAGEGWNFSALDLSDQTEQRHPLAYDPMFKIAFVSDRAAVVSGSTGTELAVDLGAGAVVSNLSCGGALVAAQWAPREGTPLLFERCTDAGYETRDVRDQVPDAEGAQAASLSRDGAQLAVVTRDNVLHLMNADSGDAVALDMGALLAGRTPSALAAVALSPDGQAIVAGFYNDVLGLYRTEDLYRSGQFGSAAQNRIESWETVTFSPSSTYLAVHRGNGRIGLWDVRQARALAEIESDADVPARHLVFDHQDRFLAEARPGGGMVLWSIDPELWLEKALALAGRPLSAQECSALLPDARYGADVTGCGGQ